MSLGFPQTRLAIFGAVLLTMALTGVQPACGANKARVELVPAVNAVAPGQPFDVALKFTLTDKWHIYWKNAGDSGLPPKVTWKLPQGFEAGPLRFPIPKRNERAGIVTNILERQPVLLVRITPPARLPPSPGLTIAAELQWLVCAEQCLRERQSVSISLPAVGSSNAVKPANETIFNRARRNQPVPRHRAKYVTITPSLGKGRLGPGSSFEIHLAVRIKPGIHIQSDKPLIRGVLPTRVFMDPIEDVFFDPPVFPKPTVRNIPKVGKLSEFGGDIVVRVGAEADTQLPGDSRTVGGLFVYQACNDKGVCYPKEGVTWSLDIPIAHAGAVGQSGRSVGTTRAGPSVESATPSDPAVPQDDSSEPRQAGGNGEEAPVSADGLEGFLARLGLGGLFLGCFLYGLSLNATPCVLPLLSIKVLGFVQQARESRRRTLLLGLAFGAGVVIFFIALGLLASAGKNVLQYPSAVIALAAVVMALALSMLGVYTLQVPTAATKLDAAIQQEGLLSSFGKGALAPVLGFACTGPLLAAAFGWATQQPPQIAILAFVFAGLGMASPYMLLGANPNWLSFLPKPGQWMITFERIMGFLLLAMVVWLLHPLITHIGAEGLEWTLGFLVVVAMGCWVLGRIDMSMSAAVRWRYRGGAAGLVLGCGVLVYGWIYPLDQARARQQALLQTGGYVYGGDWSREIPWRHWSPQAVAETVRAGKTVFVDFTAAYCTACKQNKALAINTPRTREKMRALGVVPFKGDFTSGDPEIFETLQRFNRLGVPLNLIYPAHQPDKPIVLPPSYSQQYLLDRLEEAGPSSPSEILASAPQHPSQ
ncbi:MAG: protein-disulfide reductase DsbD domain-containing protein [Phycisphaerae bacterium]